MESYNDDIELVYRVLHNADAKAFGTLMERYLLKVYMSVGRMIENKEECKDVVQQAFIQAYKKLDTWHGECFGGWITSIARNIALHHLRDKERACEVAFKENIDVLDDVYDDEHEQSLQQLEDAIKLLSTNDQQIIIWHYYEKYSLKEIAQKIGESENNVKVRIHRIRKSLKQKINYE